MTQEQATSTLALMLCYKMEQKKTVVIVCPKLCVHLEGEFVWALDMGSLLMLEHLSTPYECPTHILPERIPYAVCETLIYVVI
jgi:hypothetical protein